MVGERFLRGAGLRLAAGLLLALGLLAPPAGALAQGAPACRFALGFATLHALLPATVGTCLEDEGHNPTNGDALQRTTTGLLVWRKADNWTAFTDGYRTWVNGPAGLQQRLNSQRFSWEANPQGLPVVGVPVGTPIVATAGRTIVIRLGPQSLTAYDRGAVVLATPVTTGRPDLPTPTGEGTVFRRASPYLFISPWSLDSPYYYPPSWANWALEFRAGGYFLHDAPWQPAGTYGAGSDFGPYASHGCVHVPYSAMKLLYQWAANGTPVFVAE
jgi:lipoprotein-anchoring transpeptidase ErfK/SrfK